MKAADLKKRILAKCEEMGDCLEWTAAPSGGGGFYINVEGKTLNVRRALYAIEHGCVPPGRLVTYACDNPMCVAHQKAVTARQRNLRTAKEGKFDTPEFRARVAAGKRKVSRLSDAAVAEIRDFAGSVPEVAAKHGISAGYAYMLRRGRFRVEFSNPFGGLMR